MLALAILAPIGAAQAIVYAGQPALYEEVQPTQAGTTFTFRVPFEVDAEREAYVKVVPSPDNPAFMNGTASSGWWTTASLDGRPESKASTNGTDVVWLGAVRPGETHTLVLTVTVPRGALVSTGEIALRYALAVRSPAGEGSGGQFDESLSVTPRILVSETAIHSVEAPSSNWPWVTWGAAGAAVLVVVTSIVILAARRRRGGDE